MIDAQTIQISSEEQWLKERSLDVTSTDIAAIFGLSPYKTAYELYIEKREKQQVITRATERMTWGKRLEASIAHGVAADRAWQIEKMNVYMRDKAKRIGASFDYRIIVADSDVDGPGLLEIKNVDARQYQRKWLDDEAPAHIELQIQHQLLVSGMQWGVVAALVGGNEAQIIRRDVDHDIGRAIEAKVAAFWESVDGAVPPPIDYARDHDVIERLHAASQHGETLDATGNEQIEELAREHGRLGDLIEDLNTKKKACRAHLFDLIGTAERVTGPWGTIAAGQVRPSSGKLITEDMIGQRIGARAGYRQLNVNLKRER